MSVSKLYNPTFWAVDKVEKQLCISKTMQNCQMVYTLKVENLKKIAIKNTKHHPAASIQLDAILSLSLARELA